MSVIHPYQPFPKPECTTTVEQMQAKLEARMKKINGGSELGDGEASSTSPDGAKPCSRASANLASSSTVEPGPVKSVDEGSNPSMPATFSKPKLEWCKPTSALDTAVKTKCGTYSCCKVTVKDKPHYELWKLVPGGGWFTRIDKGSGLDNFLQAQELARQDWEKRS